MTKDLIIIRGLPGSGKSTLAKKFNTKAICTADDFHTDRQGNYNWHPERAGIAHQWCRRKCELFMKRNTPTIIVANTSTTLSELNPYFSLAKKYKYKCFSVITEKWHNGETIHGVPESTMDKMEKRFVIKLR